jgi:IclR family pca regulon transcriptional regulator
VDNKKGKYHVDALERGLSVLTYMASERRPVLLQDIVKELDINYTSATRMCSTLVDLGFVRRDSSKRYRLSTKVLTLGYAVLRQYNWIELVESRLHQLFDHLKQTVNMGIRSDASVLYLCRLRKDKYLPFDIQAGTKLPLHCTALGKALLTFGRPDEISMILQDYDFKKVGPNSITQRDIIEDQIKKIKEVGYSISDEELTPNVIAIGCPVFDSEGFALMAINVTVRKSDVTEDFLINTIAPELLSTAKDISEMFKDMKISQSDIRNTF